MDPIAIDFAAERFRSAPGLLVRASRVFFANLPFLTLITLIVFLPAKLALQLASGLAGIPTNGFLSYLMLDLSDLVLGSLVVPATIYGLLRKFRTGRTAPIGESLAWGRALWGRLLWNKFKVEITIALWGALLIVPGLMAMVRLALVDPIVTAEKSGADPLQRSRELTFGHRWRIFFVLLPLLVVGLAGSFLILGYLEDALHSRVVLALADSLLSVGGQLTTVAVLLIYLGIVPAAEAPPHATKAKRGRRQVETSSKSRTGSV